MTTPSPLPLLFLIFAVAFANAADRPNIVMFLIDDQDLDQLTVYGGETYTPNLERMAAEGMTFHQAYVSSTVCTPSRYSYLTGRYAGNAYDASYLSEAPQGQQGWIGFNMGLEDDNMNIGAVLADSGYATGFVGKYHAHGSESGGTGHGLKRVPRDAKDTPETSALFRENEAIHRKLIEKHGFTFAKNIYWGNMNKPYSQHNPEWTMEAAIEFIETNKDKPFYLHYCSTLLHGPNGSWLNSLEHPEITGAGRIDVDPSVMEERMKLKALLENQGLDPKIHFGIAWIDQNLGVLFDKLKELGLDENTLVVFAPDHGSSDKGSLYSKDGCRIPMIMRWPAGIPAGSKSDELVQNIDMVPTFFDLASATVPTEYKIDGISLKPLFENGQAPEGTWRETLYFELGSARAVMNEDWKLITMRYNQQQVEAIQGARVDVLPRLMNPLQRLGIGVRGVDHSGFWSEEQLYQLGQDPEEMNNLAKSPEYASIKKDLEASLVKHLQGFDRPYGEFIPGGNATAPGQVDKQFELVRQLKVRGKTVTVPDHLKRKNL